MFCDDISTVLTMSIISTVINGIYKKVYKRKSYKRYTFHHVHNFTTPYIHFKNIHYAVPES